MGTKDKLYLGIAFMAVGIGMIFYGLYEFAVSKVLSAGGELNFTGMDLLPTLTVAVIGGVLFAVGVALLSIHMNKQKKLMV